MKTPKGGGCCALQCMLNPLMRDTVLYTALELAYALILNIRMNGLGNCNKQ